MSFAPAETIRTADELAEANARKLLTLLSEQPEIDADLRSILKAMGSEHMKIVADPVDNSIMLHQFFNEDQQGLLPKELIGMVLSVPMTMIDFPEDLQDNFIKDMLYAAAIALSNDSNSKKAEKLTDLAFRQLQAKIPDLVDAVRQGQ